jgi:SAM-dependent methyltransferase
MVLLALGRVGTQVVKEEAVERPFEAAYWDAVYSDSARAGIKNFSQAWQGVDLSVLQNVLQLNLQPQDRVIVLGAGDSGLPEELFDAGCRNVTAVDFSKQLVAAMAERSHGALWRMEDTRKLSFPENSFDVAFDVGLLDSVATGGEEQVVASLSEAYRILSPGGIYASVSTEPPLYRLSLFSRQPMGEDGWDTKVVFIPRPRSLDPRVRRIDAALDMGKLSVYVSTKSGGHNATEVVAVDAQATVTVLQSSNGVASENIGATTSDAEYQDVGGLTSEAVVGNAAPSEAEVDDAAGSEAETDAARESSSNTTADAAVLASMET